MSCEKLVQAFIEECRIMLTESGCASRRERLWNLVDCELDWVIVTEPRHLTYFANFHPSPFVFNSQGAAAGLILGRDGSAILVADNVQAPFADLAFATRKKTPVWYRCVESAGHRAQLLVDSLLDELRGLGAAALGYEATACPAGLVDRLRAERPQLRLVDIDLLVRQLRRTKSADEAALVRQSLAAAMAALVAAMARTTPGMTELDLYRLVERAAGEAAGRQVLVYGDFVSGPRCERIGGPPSSRA